MRAKTDVHRKSSYVVKHVETVVAGTDVRARLFTLAEGDIIPWHCHSQCADHYFVLQGALTVETRDPDRLREIKRGERYYIEPRTAHQISNPSQDDCRFVLVQGVGTFDWINVGGQASAEELMEAIWVAAEMRAGGAYAHSTLMLATLAEE